MWRIQYSGTNVSINIANYSIATLSYEVGNICASLVFAKETGIRRNWELGDWLVVGVSVRRFLVESELENIVFGWHISTATLRSALVTFQSWIQTRSLGKCVEGPKGKIPRAAVSTDVSRRVSRKLGVIWGNKR